VSEKKKYRSWTVQQKLEIVLAGLRGDRSVATRDDVCGEDDQIAGDVRDEQPSQPEEADHVGAFPQTC
jgi:hypothetical protein